MSRDLLERKGVYLISFSVRTKADCEETRSGIASADSEKNGMGGLVSTRILGIQEQLSTLFDLVRSSLQFLRNFFDDGVDFRRKKKII